MPVERMPENERAYHIDNAARDAASWQEREILYQVSPQRAIYAISRLATERINSTPVLRPQDHDRRAPIRARPMPHLDISEESEQSTDVRRSLSYE